ncbi:MAG: hypothetical protein LC789_15870 [Actinobacteria bacterium]|nr:hypothetical protein [Actinomycetota bacterium]MCA1721638.1 hypothetical protein [Actinomycetota bacterium]
MGASVGYSCSGCADGVIILCDNIDDVQVGALRQFLGEHSLCTGRISMQVPEQRKADKAAAAAS